MVGLTIKRLIYVNTAMVGVQLSGKLTSKIKSLVAMASYEYRMGRNSF